MASTSRRFGSTCSSAPQSVLSEPLVDWLRFDARLRLTRAGERGAALVVGAGLTAVVGVSVGDPRGVHDVVLRVATTSADVTKGMFVATILAVPVFGLGVATLLIGAASAVGGLT